jgi:putative glutamine amidotransferase
MRRPRIGVSARFQYGDPSKHGYLKKNVYYLEESFARWLQSAGALVFLVPDVMSQSSNSLKLADYAGELDGLVLQGGTDLSPKLYGEEPIKPEWAGDPPRDRYELELLQRFLDAKKPVLGICRGQQLINVAFGGSLYQDTHTQMPGAHVHQDVAAYDDRFHRIAIEPGSGLAKLYPGVTQGKVNSIHHQAVNRLGRNLKVEAHSVEDKVVEAIRYTGPGYVLGVQWHPEFHKPLDPELLDGKPILTEFLDQC